jgi:DNA-binding response OmpR family regulator
MSNLPNDEPQVTKVHLASSPAASQAKVEVPKEGHRVITGCKTRVLVIDDDQMVADTLAMVLNFSGFDAVAAYSGVHGLELARHTAYDHVVTDVMMEPMNGIQVSIAMQTISPACTVLLISGNEQTAGLLTQSVLDGYEFEIIAKPVHPSVILDRLREQHPSAPAGPQRTPPNRRP